MSRQQAKTAKAAQWTGNVRRDGLTVRRAINGWVIVKPDGLSGFAICPCCDKPFASDRAARLCADFVYSLWP
jgi:hypothetical protein